jgi:nucleotide-binding universal stress UspA family protein
MLCAIDMSERSERAMQRALSLAHRLKAELTLLHVMAADTIAERGAAVRQQIADRIASGVSGGARQPVVELRAGEHVPTIAKVAKEANADLIILGSQRRRALAPFVGTSAEEIIALSARPALIVNLDAGVPYRNILIAAELSDVFIRVVHIARLLRVFESAAVSVVHGFESPYRGPVYAEGFDLHATRRNLEAWERTAKRRLLLTLDTTGVDSSRFRLVFHQARPVGAIQRMVRSVQPELLIIGTRDRSTLNRIMQGSTSHDMLRTIECDLLVAAPGVAMAGGR